MRAAVWYGPDQDLVIEDVEIDKPGPREVIVRTVAVGVCHSDLHLASGKSPFPAPAILGHEGAGIVEEVGELVTAVKPGDHVVAVCTPFCGRCRQCVTGHLNRCENIPVRGRDEAPRLRLPKTGQPLVQMANIGAFAEKMILHENSVVKIADDFPLETAALLSCAVVTGVGAVFNTAKVEPGSTVVVFGAGGVGSFVIQGARIAGARRIIAVDLLDNKLELALKIGATHVINASREDVLQRIFELTDGGADYSFAAAGSKRAYEQAFQCLGPGGVATVIGVLPENERIIEFDGRLLLRERRLQGSVMGSNRFIVDVPRYVELAKQGRLKLAEVVSRQLRLEDINEAFRALKAGEVARQVLLFD